MDRKFTYPTGPFPHKYVTRGGHEAEVWATDGPKKYPLQGRFRNKGGDWIAVSWAKDGIYSYSGKSHVDLLDPIREHTFWLNVYLEPAGLATGVGYRTKADADRAADPDRIACFKVTFVEGEGLENDQ